MDKVRFEEMFPAEFMAAVEKMPVFIVPFGLLEWHADHLPLGQDALKAHGLCIRLAETLGGGIVLPPNYFGRPGYSSYIGTLTFSEALIHLLISELFSQLVKVGAKVIVLITGHYGACQVDCVKRAAHVFQTEHPNVRIIAQPEYEGVTVDGLEPADHASIWETSMFMRLCPELVRMDMLKIPPLPQKVYKDPPHDYNHEPADWHFFNDVQNANPSLGEKAICAITTHLAPLVLEALEQV